MVGDHEARAVGIQRDDWTPSPHPPLPHDDLTPPSGPAHHPHDVVELDHLVTSRHRHLERRRARRPLGRPAVGDTDRVHAVLDLPRLLGYPHLVGTDHDRGGIDHDGGDRIPAVEHEHEETLGLVRVEPRDRGCRVARLGESCEARHDRLRSAPTEQRAELLGQVTQRHDTRCASRSATGTSAGTSASPRGRSSDPPERAVQVLPLQPAFEP